MSILTHFVDYSLPNMGTDLVVTACGRLIHIKYFSVHPTCTDLKCVKGAAKHRLGLAITAHMKARRG